MNSTGYPPPYGADGVSGSMKAFFILVLLFLVFLFSASAGLGQVDLTPDTPAVNAQSVPVTGADVISIQDNTALNQQPVVTGETKLQVPVTGTCNDPYLIKSGDSLSQIAVLCDTSMASIRQANPQITNANMIYPGQQIRIPRGSAPVSPTAVPLPVTGNEVPQTAPTTAPSIMISGQAPVIRTGTGLQVKAVSFPANTPLNIAIGPQNQGYNIVASGITDANGYFSTRITVPTSPDAQTPWVVVVATTGNPPVQAMSQPFFIGAAVP